jgi:hypothetical protein
MEPEGSLPHLQAPAEALWNVLQRLKLLAPRRTPKLEGHPLSAVCDWLCVFNIFAAALHAVVAEHIMV